VGETVNRSANVVGVTVRPVRCEERERWRQLMNAHHYLGFRPIVGQSLCYVATCGEQWVALLGWGAAALKCVWPAGRLDRLDARLEIPASASGRQQCSFSDST